MCTAVGEVGGHCKSYILFLLWSGNLKVDLLCEPCHGRPGRSQHLGVGRKVELYGDQLLSS